MYQDFIKINQMTITIMAIKATFHIVLMTVLLCTCSAVKVTIGDLGDIIEGSETKMMCNIERDNPTSTADPVITWNNITNGDEKKIGALQSGSKFIDNAYSDRFDIDINDGSLMISNTLRSDSGTYQCSVTILYDNPAVDDDDVVLDVFYLETPVLMISTPMIEGEKVELICTTVANPEPVFTFKKDGANVQSSNHHQSSYVIQSVHRNDTGNYQCEVMNGAGTKSTTSQKLEVYYAPEITSLDNIEAYPGEAVVIDFSVEANPAAAYEWTTNPATTDTDSNSNTYTLVVSTEAIGTVYTLTLNASNIVGAIQRSVNVTVVDPCAEDPCENSGNCTVVQGGYICNCTEDFTGKNCSICIYENDCASMNGTLYNHGNGTCGCDCGPCRPFNMSTHSCGSLSCVNGGVCVAVNSDTFCDCPSGFNGTLCENKIPTRLFLGSENNSKEVLPGEIVEINLDVEANTTYIYEWKTNPATMDTDNKVETYTFVVSEKVGTVYTVTLNASSVNGSIQKSAKITVIEATTGPVWVREQHRRDVRYRIIGASLGAGAVVTMVISALIYKCACKASFKVLPAEVEAGKDALISFKCGQTSKASFEWYKCDQNGQIGDSGPIAGSDQSTDGIFSFTEKGLEIATVEMSDAGYYSCVMTKNNKRVQKFTKLTVYEKSKEQSSSMGRPNGACSAEGIEMKQGKDGLSRYQAPGGQIYTQVNLKQKNPEKKAIPAQVDKNVEGLMYADLDLTRNLPKDQKDTIHHPEPETISIQQQHSTKICQPAPCVVQQFSKVHTIDDIKTDSTN